MNDDKADSNEPVELQWFKAGSDLLPKINALLGGPYRSEDYRQPEDLSARVQHALEGLAVATARTMQRLITSVETARETQGINPAQHLRSPEAAGTRPEVSELVHDSLGPDDCRGR